jgi:RHS repeat-associated protein
MIYFIREKKPMRHPPVNSHNQITTSGYTYDGAGDMIQDASGATYTFDAAERIINASGVTNGPYSYLYDGNGLRIAKTYGSTGGTLYWRDILGQTTTETDTGGGTITSEYIYYNGRRIARRDGMGSIYYRFGDQLNNTRAVATASGSECFRSDYTPYGQELSILNTCTQTYKFTGNERDGETGLDYGLARFYSSRIGRFLTTDPIPGDLSSA